MKAIIYLLQVSACTGIFYLFYYLFLRRLTFFPINRWYLLATLLLSFVIPAITIPVSETQSPAIMQPIIFVHQAQVINEPTPVILHHETAAPQINWILTIRYTYLVMAFISITHLLISLALFFWRMRREKLLQIGNVKILKADKAFGNSSFLNVIFINDDGLEPDEIKQIIAHELLHVKLLHSADRLIARLVQVVLWFNPFAYLYIRAIEENHEFEVDRIASSADNKGIYATLLFKLAASGRDYLFHGFSQVPIKKRIIMLFNQPTKNMKKIIYVLMLPLVVVSCLAFANLKKDDKTNDVKIKNHHKAGDDKPDSVKTAAEKRAFGEKLHRKFKEFIAYEKTDEAKEKNKFAASLKSTTIKVKITGVKEYKDFFEKDRHAIFSQYNGHDFLMPAWYGQEKQLNSLLKAGDVVTINVFRSFWGFGKGAALEITPAYVIKDNQKIFQLAEADKLPTYAFLTDANKVHYAEGQISNIVKYANGKWKTALFETVNGYRFNLSFKPDAPDLGSIADGDHVRLRFVNEVKTATKEFRVNDWVSITTYEQEYKNPNLFNKYYTDVQKTGAQHTFANEDSTLATPIKIGADGQPIRFAKKDAPQSVLDEYADILKKSDLPFKADCPINLKPNFSAAERERLKILYIQMSRKQQLRQYVRVVPKFGLPVPAKYQSPTQQQLITWQDSGRYSVDIDMKRVKNKELSKYKPSDFDEVLVSHNIYSNANLHKKIPYGVSLNTKVYLANFIKHELTSTEYSMAQNGKGHELLIMYNW